MRTVLLLLILVAGLNAQTYQQFTGWGTYLPDLPRLLPTPAFSGSLINNVTGGRLAFCGRVWFAGRTGTFAIRRVGFRFGTVVKAGGSGLTVSLQDPDATGGQPQRPDGTQDQTVAIANGDASFVSDTWYRTGTLSADRTVTYGDRLCVVVEWDGSGRLGSDSYILSTLSIPSTSGHWGDAGSISYNGTSWSQLTQCQPNIVIESSGGSWGTLEGSFVASAITANSVNTGSTPDEYALEFTVPVAMKVDGLFGIFTEAATNRDAELILYDGTTALATLTYDANYAMGTGAAYFIGPITEQTLSTSATYRVAIKPTSANNVTIYTYDVNDAGHWALHSGQSAWAQTTRSDAGSWAAVTATRRIWAGVRISSMVSSGGSGGSFTFVQ